MYSSTHTTESSQSYANLINPSLGRIGVHIILLKEYASQVNFDEMPLYSTFQLNQVLERCWITMTENPLSSSG
jgi:hypothetical protein